MLLLDEASVWWCLCLVMPLYDNIPWRDSPVWYPCTWYLVRGALMRYPHAIFPCDAFARYLYVITVMRYPCISVWLLYTIPSCGTSTWYSHVIILRDTLMWCPYLFGTSMWYTYLRLSPLCVLYFSFISAFRRNQMVHPWFCGSFVWSRLSRMDTCTYILRTSYTGIFYGMLFAFFFLCYSFISTGFIFFYLFVFIFWLIHTYIPYQYIYVLYAFSPSFVLFWTSIHPSID